MRIHHIGYLVKKIDKAIEEFERLGYVVEKETVFDDIRKVDICFMIKDGYRVELVSPAADDSVVRGLYLKFGNGPYHICYETEHFDDDLDYLHESHYVDCDETKVAPALSDRRVCFLIHASLGMIELLEK